MNRKIEDLDLFDLVYILKKYIALIVLVTLVFGMAGLFYSKRCVVPQYQAEAQILVNIPFAKTDYINMYDAIQLNQSEINTYMVVLKSNDVLNSVIRDLGLKKSKSELSNEISITSVNATEVLDIKVIDESPAAAKAVAEELLKYAPSQTTRVVKTGSVEIIAEPEISNAPVVSYKKFIVPIAILVGFVLSFIGAITAEMFDSRFKNADEVQKYLRMDVLCVIPDSKRRNGKVK